MTEQPLNVDERRKLVETFSLGDLPEEIVVLFNELTEEFESRGIPVKAVVPLMSLQGEWAIKKLLGKKRGYGDIDWGVVLDCPADKSEEILREARSLGEEFFRKNGQNPCTEITPVNYFLNMRDIGELVKELPSACEAYLNGDPQSQLLVVRASLPLLSNDSDLVGKYLDLLRQRLLPENFEVAVRGIALCVDWMKSAKSKKTGLRPEAIGNINALRRLPHHKAVVTEMEVGGPEKSFGVIAMKPTGMTSDVPEIIDYVLSLDKGTDFQQDEVVATLMRGMSEEERDFFVTRLRKIKLRFTRFGDYSQHNSFWVSAYEERHQKKFWYVDLMKMVNRGTLFSYIVEGEFPNSEMERWLDLFKGKENIVRTLPGGEVENVKRGKGIRGLYDSEAVMVSREQVLSALGERIEKFSEELSQFKEGQILFTELPKRMAPLVWEILTEEEKQTMLGNYVHMSGKPDEVFKSGLCLLQSEVGDVITNRLLTGNFSPEKAMAILVDVYALIENNEPTKESNLIRLYPEDTMGEKGSYSYGMFVVKPTGMDGDFPDMMRFLFDPTYRNDENWEEVVRQVEETFSEDYRPTYRRILNETSLDTTFYGAHEPGEEPYFWEANYFKKNGGRFYYRALLDGFKGGQMTETFLIRSGVKQEELDEWIKKVKGRETLKSHRPEDNTDEVLYKGYGLRGMLEVEAIMFTEAKKKELVSKITDQETLETLGRLLEGIKLPVIYSRLPDLVQELLWEGLSSSEQQAMISNFIHSPDDIDTVYDGLIELSKLTISESDIAEIIRSGEGKKNVIIFNLVTETLKRKIPTSGHSAIVSRYRGNTRALSKALELENQTM